MILLTSTSEYDWQKNFIQFHNRLCQQLQFIVIPSIYYHIFFSFVVIKFSTADKKLPLMFFGAHNTLLEIHQFKKTCKDKERKKLRKT